LNFSDFNGKSVLITGATGYLGSWLTEALVENGAQCCALSGPSGQAGWLTPIMNRIELVSVDLSKASISELKSLIGGHFDYIFHMAAAGVDQTSANPERLVEVNVNGTINLLNYAHGVDVKSIIVTGSGFEYPPGACIKEDIPPAPQALYALCKAASSMLSISYNRLWDMPISVLRPFVVYGPREADHRLITQLCESIIQSRPVEMGSGKPLRDWVFVKDVIRAHLLAALTPKAVGQIINISSGTAVSVRQVAELFVDIIGGDTSLLQFNVRSDRPNEIWSQTGCTQKARDLLGWEATTTLKKGLLMTFEWYKSYA